MAIDITRTEHGYTAIVTPRRIVLPQLVAAVEEAKAAGATPPFITEPWETTEPMTREDLRAELLKRGANVLDIEDAFRKSDPNWKLPVSDPERARKLMEADGRFPPDYRKRNPYRSGPLP